MSALRTFNCGEARQRPSLARESALEDGRFRDRIEAAVDALIGLLDAIDAPVEDREPEPLDDDLDDLEPEDAA